MRTSFFKTISFTAVCLLTISAIASAQDKDAKDVKAASLDWLTGCWELSVPQRNMTITEHWMRPAGGILVGMGRTVVGEKAVTHEYLRIIETADGLAYIAKPSQNKEETIFKLIKASGGELVFENLEHDFPQRIIYRKDGADSLFARIEGTRNGELRGMDFPKKRVKCD